MQVKKELRKQLSAKRRAIPDKAVKDKQICDYICNSDYFKRYRLILFYSALHEEVNLNAAISRALELGVSVALPYCNDKNGNMSFYYISSLDDLVSGSFGIFEPDTEKCREVDDFSNSLCIVPAIAFDSHGYRLGYGKGYYDRFLSAHRVYKTGVCYNELLVDNLPLNEYDIAVDILLTENGFVSI